MRRRGPSLGKSKKTSNRFRLGVAIVFAMIAALLAPTAVGAQDETPKDDEVSDASPDRLSEPTPVDVGARVVTPAQGGGSAEDGGVFYVQYEEALSGSDREALEDAGVSIGQAVASSTYVVRVPAGAADPIVQREDFLGLAAAVATDALSPALRSGDVPVYATTGNGDVVGTIEFFPNVTLAEALAAADSAGVSLPDRSAFLAGNRLNIEGSVQQITALAGFDGALYLSETAAPPIEHNATARNVNAVPIGPGTGGSGVIMGIWDGGSVRSTHQDLVGRVINNDGGGFSNHATHVAGTMIGSGAGNASALGLAPSVPTLHSYDFTGNVVTEMTTSHTNQNIVVSNNSWGNVAGRAPGFCGTGWCTEDGFGAYTTTARDWDNMVIATDLITVKSSGNDRNDCGAQAGDTDNCDGFLGADGQYYDNISDHGNAKNVITVGAVEDDGTSITSFSSAGPADDGRIKPDVVANGAAVLSTCSSSDTAYCALSGTSMSTPVVSGLIAHIHQQYTSLWASDLPAELAKAAIVNSATDLGRPGPDYLYGYGNVNGGRARDNVGCCNRFKLASVADGEDHIYTITAAGGTDLRITLAWLDPAGVANSATADIVNNLDLMLISPSGAKTYPWRGPGRANPTGNALRDAPNTIDTVEQVDVANAEAGVWHVRVTGTSVPTGPQDYALVSALNYGATVTQQELIDCSVSNDDFDDAVTLTGFTPTATVDSSCATGESGELPHDPTSPRAGSPYSSLWWEWTAPTDGPVTVDTAGTESGLDTVLGVYTGTAVGALTIVAQDDDTLGSTLSTVSFAAVGGTTYKIAVDGWDEDEVGDVKVNLTFTCVAPANDDLADAATLTGASATDTVDNTCATAETGELSHDNALPVAPSHSVWWEWTAPATGPATADTLGSLVSDTVLGVYTGTDVTALAVIGRDDDSAGSGQARVTFAAVSGTTYKIAIDGWNSAQIGDVTVNVMQTPPQLCDGLVPTLVVPSGGADFFGTQGNDVILGTSGVDRIFGLGGNDTICGEPDGAVVGDDDNLNGGNGLDTILGGPGNDFVGGQGGVDTLFGGPGDDEIAGGIGNDIIRGGDGEDTLRGQGNDDQLFGEGDVDTIFGGSGNDTIETGPGGNLGTAHTVTGNGNNDTITGSPDADLLDGQNGLDSIHGEGGNDTLNGGLGFDRLNGGDGDDTLNGFGSRDILHGDGDNDIVNGGAGPDDLFGDAGTADVCNGGPDTDATPDASCETITGVP